jgi:uncharacterized protein with HEPN domain
MRFLREKISERIEQRPPDSRRVWDTITDDLPPLVASLEKIILQDDKGP